MAASLSGLVDELRSFASDLDALVSQAGLSGQFTSTYRSRSEQERLYRAYISGRHNLPVLPPGFSAHEYGEAFDYLVTPSSYQSAVGRVWQSWGGTWAGASDPVHFELPGATERARERASQDENLIAYLARKFNDLPWWATIALPIASTTTERTPAEEERFAHPLDYLCKTYGLFC